MYETSRWLLVVITTLASVALGLLSAWLLLKVVFTFLMRGSAFGAKVETPLETKHIRG
jgi:hypothetical protein